MCNDLCQKCGEPQCENVCTCTPSPYTDNNCEVPTDFKCVILEKTDKTFPCLDFEEGDNLLELLEKVEVIKCALNEVDTNSTDEKVKTIGTDLVSGYLFDKVVGNECITWTVVDLLGNIKLKPQIDFNCVLSKLITLPLFCSTVINCVASLPPDCNPIGSVVLSNATSTTLSYIIVPGLNNTSFVYSLFLDASLSTSAAPTQNLTTTIVTFTGLTPNTQYWLQVQPICSNGGTTNYTSFGPQSTTGIINPSCPSITVNTPVIINNIMTVSWVGGVGATNYNVYINNTLVSNQTNTTYVSGPLPNGNYIVRVDALPCATGTPQSGSQGFVVNYVPACIQPSNVTLLVRTISNICPSFTVNLSGLIVSTPPGVVVEWYTDSIRTTLITNPNSYTAIGDARVYVFTKDIVTNCYSDPIEVRVVLTPCNVLPAVSLNCQHHATILDGTFIKDGTVHNGNISIPVTVSGSGPIYGNVFGNGFTGTFYQAVTPATTALSPVSISYDGMGGIEGDNLISVSIVSSFISNGPQVCYTSLPIECPTCDDPLIDISGITSTDFTVTVTNLLPGDNYGVTVTKLSDSSIVIFANNLTTPYLFTGGITGTDYIVTVTIACACGNSATASVITATT